MDEMDELDRLLDGNRAEMEARFRELEMQERLRAMRDLSGEPDAPEQGRRAPDPNDPLSDLKAKMDEADAPPERFLLVECPHCSVTNRLSLTRVRTGNPICGKCKEDLAVGR